LTGKKAVPISITRLLVMVAAAGLLPVIARELIGSGILMVPGIIQTALSLRLAREVGAAVKAIGPAPDRDRLIRQMRRPVRGFRILALISFLLAALGIVIPAYIFGLYKF